MLSAKTKIGALALAVVIPLGLLALLRRAADRRPHLFIGIGAPANAIALSRDGSQIVCTSDNGYIQKWMPDRQRFNSLRNNGIPQPQSSGYSTTPLAPIELRFSPDEKLLIAANYGQLYQQSSFAWTMSDRNPAWNFALPAPGAKGWPSYACFTISPDARLLACSGSSLRVLDLTRPAPTAPPQPHSYQTSSAISTRLARDFPIIATLPAQARVLAISPDDKSLATVTWKGQLQLWNIAARTQKPLAFVSVGAISAATISALSFSPDGRFLAIVFSDSSMLAIYDFTTSNWTRSAPPSAIPPFSSSGNPPIPTPPVWMPDSHSLWTGNDKVRRWNAPDLKILRELPVGGPVAVSGDGRTLATRSIPKAGEPNGIWLWKIS